MGWLAKLRVPLGWSEVIQPTVKEALKDNVVGGAAYVAYYLLLAVLRPGLALTRSRMDRARGQSGGCSRAGVRLLLYVEGRAVACHSRAYASTRRPRRHATATRAAQIAAHSTPARNRVSRALV